MTDEFFDALETRDPAEREAALMAALPAQVAATLQTRAGAWALRGVDAAAVTTRAALAALPVTRKHELLVRQQAERDARRAAVPAAAGAGATAPGAAATHPDAATAADGGGMAADPFGGHAAIGWRATGAARPARRVFQSPGPIYEPEGHVSDPWRFGRALFAAGLRSGDLVHNSFSYHLTPAGAMMECGAFAVGCTVFPGGVGNTEAQLQAMADLRPDAYAGTPSFLRIVLEKADAAGIALPWLTKASVGGEAFPPLLRDALLARGIAAFQSYGTADVGLIAYETAAREGLVVDESVIVEIVRPGTGDPVADGDVGEVVVTVLGNADHPLLRFGTGDLSAVLAGPCPSGRTNRRIKGWLGRADQTAKVRGMFVHPSQVADIARRHAEVGRLRLVVEGEMADDRMTLHAECTGRPDGLAERIAQTLRDVTKLRGSVLLCAPGSLANDGKVIDDLRRLG